MLLCYVVLLFAAATFAQPKLPDKFALASNPIELTRTARPNQYIEAVGRKAALFGHETGVFESWVFPIKLFHDTKISIQVEGQDAAVDFSQNVERIIARPEATTLIASNQLFTMRAHFLTPIQEQGSLVLLDIDTARPLTLTVSFVPDLKPMWPGGLGGQAAYWRDDLKAFIITESRRKYNGFFGCPAATKGVATPAHQLASGALRFDIKVDPQLAKKHFYPLIIAGSTKDRQTAIDLYNKLATTIPDQYQQTFAHYRRLRDELLSIETPDEKLNLAFEWAKVSLDKGMVDNPDLGLGLVAGWNATGDGARPGFGWYFGGDAAINSYAMTAAGDWENVKATFRFLAKYQRADGKIPHEISQSAGMIKWFEEYPYGFIHADTTPFYIAAIYNYYLQSGDSEFIKELWPVLKKAYQFCVVNDSDGDGILENSKAGLGASELGSLLENLHQDIYLAATNLEASTAMTSLAEIMGDSELARAALERKNKAREAVNTRYWNADEKCYAYALTNSGKQNMEATAWTAVPMMFGQLQANKVAATVSGLASANLSTDWGTRMLGASSAAYSPIAYNNGGVWPFLTGFVALGEYQYQRSHSGFAHLQQVANLAFDFALGYRPEILSGDYYRPLDESVPHQFFSVGMTITPFVRGLLGLRASEKNLCFAPQMPAAWDKLKVRNILVGRSRLTIEAERFNGSVRYVLSKDSAAPLSLQLAPSLPLLAKPLRVTVDNKPVQFKIAAENAAPICSFVATLQAKTIIEISYTNDVELDVPFLAPQIGERTTSLKVLDITAPASNKLTVKVEGLARQSYNLRWRGGAIMTKLSGATAKGEKDGWKLLEVTMPAGEGWQTKTIELEFK
ncbi:MAG TPA: GH116 family glycosyl hydrolase [Blastocatellia bacterium]|nr:GH116 family glycosyl hydrolase [Blastocatellia bacterium]